MKIGLKNNVELNSGRRLLKFTSIMLPIIKRFSPYLLNFVTSAQYKDLRLLAPLKPSNFITSMLIINHF